MATCFNIGVSKVTVFGTKPISIPPLSQDGGHNLRFKSDLEVFTIQGLTQHRLSYNLPEIRTPA